MKFIKAFTLIELLISLSVMAVMSAILIPAFGDFSKKQSLIQVVENFRNDIELMQSKSVSGVGADTPVAPVRWGINCDCASTATNKYSIGFFSNAGAFNEVSEVIPDPVVSITCTSNPLIFALNTGFVGSTISYTITSSELPTFPKTITVSQGGQVTIN